jgi:uncharacterized protein (DUF736 family)
MPAIGYVTRTETGFKGQLNTISVRADIEIIPNSAKASDAQPDYRVLANGIEVGAGWIRIGERSGKDYVSLSFCRSGVWSPCPLCEPRPHCRTG